MRRTTNLKLPIYDTPETDVFIVEEWNNANISIDNAYSEVVALKTEIPSLNAYAESVRSVNEESRRNAETIRLSNEEARINAESSRILEENARKNEEANRLLNEETRKSSETTRLLNEDARKNVEAIRVSNEDTRISSEIKRISDEEARKGVEATRVIDEQARKNEEAIRQLKEQERLTAEATRVENELIRRKEIEEARKDFNGVTKESLSKRLASDMDYVNDRFNKATLVENEAKYISASKSYDGITKDLKIKGRTLQNLLANNELYNKSYWFNSGEATTVDTSIKLYKDKSIKFNTNNVASILYSDVSCDQTHKYLLSVYIYISSHSNSSINILVRDYGASTNNTQSSVDTTKLNVWQRVSVIVTGKAGGGFRAMIGQNSPGTAIFNIDGIMLYDLTNMYGAGKEPTDIVELEKYLPYVDNIKSVGEEGGFDVVSCGKNLFDLSKIIPLTEKVTISNDKIFIKNIYSSYNNCDLNKKLKPNTKYYISRKIEGTIPQNGATGRIAILNVKNNNILPLLSGGYDSVSSGYFTTPNDIVDYSSLLMYGNSSTDDIVFSNIIISEIATPYEPYKETRIPITLNAPLRSLPSGVKDELDIENNKIIRRIGKVVLNGSENWWTYSANSNENINAIAFGTIPNMKGGICICDNFKYTPSPTDNATQSINTHNSKYIYILFDKKLVSDLPSGKAYLQQNPTTVYYELATPIEEPIVLPNNLRTYDNITNIFTEGSLIEPNIYAKIPSDVIALTDIRNSTVKSKIFNNADERVEELEQDVKNIVTQEEWITPTLLNGTTNIGGVPIKYMKDTLGFVHIRGWFSQTGANILFVLPVNYRPSQPVRFACGGSGSVFILRIETTGDVKLEKIIYGETSSLSLDNIIFKAEK